MSSPEYDRIEFHNSLIGTSPVESDGHITDGCRLDDIAKCKNVCLVNHKSKITYSGVIDILFLKL